MTANRLIALALIALAGSSLAACGGDDDAPPGSPDNPVVATHPEDAATDRNEGATDAKDGKGEGQDEQPGFKQLVDRQAKRPVSRFSPCNLVTRDEAAEILRAPIETPFEAPQGPTCIYKGTKGSPFVTVAVQEVDFDQLERRLRKPREVDVAGRTAYCGSYGRETLYVPLDDGRVLSISSSCERAQELAERAIPRLRA